MCALYASERWNALLAEVLPRLMNCQRQLHDWSGYLVSCIKLLSLDSFLVPTEDRHSLEDEIVNLAHNVLKVPMSLDVSALITFAARGGAPLELCDSDPGILEVVVWSGFVDGVSLESLSLTLMATFSADEGAQVGFSYFYRVPHSFLFLASPFLGGNLAIYVVTGTPKNDSSYF